MLNPALLELAESVRQDLIQQNWNNALLKIKIFVEKVIDNPYCHGIVVDVPGLDALCQQVGQAIIAHTNEISTNNINKEVDVLYIVSQLYTSGGHTAVIEDFISAQPEKKHVILFTDIFNLGEDKAIKERFSKYIVELVWLKEKTLLLKFISLRNAWRAINPLQVFLFNHHQDVVAVAASTKEMPGKLYFYHHTDFQLGLGMRLAHAIHIDIHAMAYAHCRKLNITNNVLLPLTCKDHGVRELTLQSFRKQGKLHTISAGAYYKYALRYPYVYFDLIPAILQASQGTHTHIGFLWPAVRRRIHKKLKTMNIDPNRFNYLSVVPYFWQTLKSIGADLYITSFPIGGGRTCLEVMGSGTPIIYHKNFRSPLLSEQSLIYEDGLCWKTPEELLSLLREISADRLLDHAKRGRKHYEENYGEELLKDRLHQGIGNGVVKVPSMNLEIISPGVTQLLTEISDQFSVTRSWFGLKTVKQQLKKVAKKLIKIGQSW
jgi:hypothetical protein